MIFKSLKKDILVLLSLIVAGSSGCLSVKMASPQLDRAAKEFAPPADKAYIYVIRRSAFILYNEYMTVQLTEHRDNKIYNRAKGSLVNGTYLLFEVPPGDFEVHLGRTWVDPAQVAIFGQASVITPNVRLQTLPGRMYFIESKFEGFGNPYVNAKLIPNPEDGKEALLESKRALSIPLEE